MIIATISIKGQAFVGKKCLQFHQHAKDNLSYGIRKSIPGVNFARFGFNLGADLANKLNANGSYYLIAPVNITRYFEFPFVLSHMDFKNQCDILDVGSPRLFGFYINQNVSLPITIINPDVSDIAVTQNIIQELKLNNIKTQCIDIKKFARSNKKFDYIYAISVIEHISGDYDDREAIKIMYNLLKPGGKLILTIPVDKIFRNEYRGTDTYNLNEQNKNQYFFQRVYDKNTINERLIESIGINPSVAKWFGETISGRFVSYEQEWLKKGFEVIVNDPREIADFYKTYNAWEKMPGFGVCGLVFEKNTQGKI